MAGCVSDTRIATLSDGASKVFTPPKCVPDSNSKEGRRWIAVTIERGISALGWKRPEKKCVPDLTKEAAALPPKAIKKKSFFRRALNR